MPGEGVAFGPGDEVNLVALVRRGDGNEGSFAAIDLSYTAEDGAHAARTTTRVVMRDFGF